MIRPILDARAEIFKIFLFFFWEKWWPNKLIPIFPDLYQKLNWIHWDHLCKKFKCPYIAIEFKCNDLFELFTSFFSNSQSWNNSKLPMKTILVCLFVVAFSDKPIWLVRQFVKFRIWELKICETMWWTIHSKRKWFTVLRNNALK